MQDLHILLGWMIDWSPLVAELAFAVVAFSSAVAAISPTPPKGHWIGKAYRVLDIVALNVGYAKDKPEQQGGGRFVVR